MRKLYYAPVVHTMDECLPGLREILKRRSYDTDFLDESTEAYFEKLGKKAERLYGNVDKVYRDSLADGHERGLKEIKRLKGPTSELMLNFANAGARLMKTESISLVCTIEVIYGLLKEVRSERKRNLLLEFRTEFDALRDRYVAHRIGATLCEGETAVLLMGAEHRVRFDRSINVEYIYTPDHVERESDKAIAEALKRGRKK